MALNVTALNNDCVNNGIQVQATIILSISQQVDEKILGDGVILSIENKVDYVQPGYPLLYISQQVVQAGATNTFYSRNGWEPIITLGAQSITASVLTGEILVIKQEDDNHLAVFNMLLPPSIYNLYDYQGKAVTINVRKGNTISRIYTGVVDVPVVDAINEKITINCIADRRALLEANASLEPYLGIYSSVILGENLDAYERINARLSTMTDSLDFDSYNAASINSWTPKASPDFSYGSGAVYRRDPTLKIESAAKIVNEVDITMQYGYQRLHHKENIYFWEHPYAPIDPQTGTGGICAFLEDAPSMPTKELITQAAQGAGWPCYNFEFGRQFRSGSYNCSGTWVQWSTQETSFLNAPIVNGDGSAAVDSSGNPLTRSVTTVISDNTDLYTMNAQWLASTQFNQNMNETYTLTVKAPLSQSRYGVLQSVEAYGYTDPNQYEEWENYTAYRDAPSGATLLPAGHDSTYYINGDANRASFNLAVLCAMYKAQSQILKSHRDTTISFQRDLTPTMELKHTVALTGKWIRGKGKVKRIEHHMSISDSNSGAAGECWTHIDLAQYRTVGTTSANAITVPTGFNDQPTVYMGTVNLDTHLGEDPSLTGSEYWTGYVGNKQIIERIPAPPGTIFPTVNYTRTNYQESFIVNSPAVEDQFRQQRNLAKAVNYSINIPTDDTSYESYG